MHARALARTSDNRWAFGAGAQAVTYVSSRDEDSYLEHGLSWYRKSGTTALTPGHTDARGVAYRTFGPDAEVLRCFRCHSTGTLALTETRSVKPSEPGVHCEACHGPGAIHAAKPERASIRNPKDLTAAGINDLCGQCHRMPTTSGAITNFENPWNVRHQPVYFSQSACFLKSGGKLSCLTCHAPHQDTKVNGETVCAQCHAQPRHTMNVAGQLCTSCHMPVVAPSPNLSFVNHWIGVYRLTGPAANPLRPVKQRAGR